MSCGGNLAKEDAEVSSGHKMDYRIADTFTDSLSRLPGKVHKTVAACSSVTPIITPMLTSGPSVAGWRLI